MATVAFNATLFNNNVGISGIAMRTNDRRVFFVDDATQVWRELFDADASNLCLHGRVDLALSQSILDGNLVVKASRTCKGLPNGGPHLSPDVTCRGSADAEPPSGARRRTGESERAHRQRYGDRQSRRSGDRTGPL